MQRNKMRNRKKIIEKEFFHPKEIKFYGKIKNKILKRMNK